MAHGMWLIKRVSEGENGECTCDSLAHSCGGRGSDTEEASVCRNRQKKLTEMLMAKQYKAAMQSTQDGEVVSDRGRAVNNGEESTQKMDKKYTDTPF